MRQLLLALANWISVLEIEDLFRWMDGIIAKQSDTDVFVFDSEGRAVMLYSIMLYYILSPDDLALVRRVGEDDFPIRFSC